MKHFRIHIIVVILLFFVAKSLSQNPKIDQARANFISQKIQLSPDEKIKFWPVYNEYMDKIKGVLYKRKKLYNNYNYSLNPSDAEDFLKKTIQLDIIENQIKEEYIQKFKQIIGVVKTSHLLKAEADFRLELIKILKSDKPD